MGEEFVVSTWPYKFRGVFGQRNFVMESTEGETLAYADSYWFYFDQNTGKPVQPTEEETKLFGIGEPYPMEYCSRKVLYPDDVEYVDSIQVCENHLDTNEHMNNGEYLRIAANYLPNGYSVKELMVEYRLAAKLGDKIQIYTKQEDGCFYVVMMKEPKTPYVITCFKGGE
jgi:acyl-ACP thioesterase